ncbi:hypothetical protein CDV55_103848 [Aspergillus turcosus]|uniref:HNH nuclease domain-containing protein n=1 Tax=Aspergillus turcosus TaxID=1245748 RepID=A0A229YVB5_9EURO|nr:hypothetical protein CDV55_103848 [Aspergillus turcosus]RLL94814.1 hypothetical protein CFD26_104182 [Aspergillus turcosus]
MATPSHTAAPPEDSAPVPLPGALFAEPERVELINKIAKKLGETKHTKKLSTFKTCYAGLWLADVEKLKDLADDTPLRLYGQLLIAETEHRIGHRWQGKDNDAESRAPSAPPTPSKDTPPPLFSSSSVPGPSPGDSTSEPPTSTPRRHPPPLDTSGSLDKSRKRPGKALGTPERAKKPRIDGDVAIPRPRDKRVTQACFHRDKTCVLTNGTAEMCKGCHVFPYSMNNWDTHRVDMFFEGLRMFWCDEKVDEWRKVLHTAGWFALEPVAEDVRDGKWLKLRFWWLKRHEHQGGVQLGIPPQLPKDLLPKEHLVALHRVDNDEPLTSGKTITLRTHNPQTHPLPDTRLLRLQWIMGRVLALRGAAEPEELEDDSDGDSDEGLPYPTGMPVLESPNRPGQSSPPSSITNIASDQPKANPVIATTDTPEQGVIEE